MKNILEELYNGNLDYRIITADEKYRETYKNCDEKESNLINSFNAEQNRLYDEYCEAKGVLDGMLSAENFIRGFKCGVKIFCDVFHEK